MKTILQIGYGYWGKKIYKNLINFNKYKILIFDPYVKSNSNLNFIKNYNNINPDFVIISTTVKHHEFYIQKFINKKIPIYVEKPLLNFYKENLSYFDYNKKIFTGYVYLYNSFIIKLKKLILKEKSKLLFLKFERKNLGPIRKDVDVLYDLASHDLSILSYLFENKKFSIINVTKQKIVSKNRYDQYNIELKIDKFIRINIEVSWLNIDKVRKISAFFDKKMILFDETKNLIIEKFINNNFYEKKLFNIDNLSIRQKEYSYSQNPLQNQLKNFLSNNQNVIKENINISKKTQKYLDLIYKWKK